MRIANGVFAVLLILFVAVQINDPDGPLWMVIYGAGVVWSGLAAFRPEVFLGGAFWAFLATVAAAFAGLVYYWPDTPHWWMQEVWWETETAREGMGMMILLFGLFLAGWVAMRIRRTASAPSV